MRHSRPSKLQLLAAAALLFTLMAGNPLPAGAQAELPNEPLPVACLNTVTANVVALDQPWMWNRFGAMEPQGQMFALRHDVVPSSWNPKNPGACYSGYPSNLQYGNVKLRRDKRPRPLVLRINEGDCLEIHFTNLLDSTPTDDEQPHTRSASFHIVGMHLVNTIRDAGHNLGQNTAADNGIVQPGQSVTYTYYAATEGTYVAHSLAAPVGGEGDAGSISTGLFAAVTVEPYRSEWYRSQVTEAILDSTRTDGNPNGYPTIDYAEEYTTAEDCLRGNFPKLNMLDPETNQIVHSDLTAVITGRNRGNFGRLYPDDTKVYPNRKEPFREFTIIFHDEIAALQAFPQFYNDQTEFTLHSVRDAFAINYGTGGIGAEILANRLETGPVHECVDCLYEEFFLSAWAVGDPAMIVDKPANYSATNPCDKDSLDPPPGSGIPECTPDPGRKATIAYYPDDPSNVYHSYINDHVKFRNLHAGSDDHHIFHLHAHQWMRSPKDPNSTYLDSQTIGQGSTFTYEIAYEGSGNRNKTPGDSIFHCHFYPHFAQGMWSMWRSHDVLELGTELDGAGRPAQGSRALPDGEIWAGTPIPAIVPLPNQPMAVLPAPVQIVNGQVDIIDPIPTLQALFDSGQKDYVFPGYPFYVPAIAGHRPPHPPLDTIDDGGLARHVVSGPGISDHAETRLDFHKHLLSIPVEARDELGEPVEQLAMDFHHNPTGYTSQPLPNGSGLTATYALNKGARQPGAPYADPCLQDDGTIVPVTRTYRAADIQMDVVFNKSGWHFPQQRIITLLDDVLPTLAGTRPPEPFFFRANSGECIQFESTNLVPYEYELDDFQVRTPTDILGQHIHLVKFDVTSSDGGGNGFNYEDGTFSPEEVQSRVEAIRDYNGCDDLPYDPPPSFECPEARPHPIFGDGPNVNCNEFPDYRGAQTTVQRWWADPVLLSNGDDQTLRTVFTHDHFGPSTHQQVGLYAGLVVEPENSRWFHNETGVQLGTRNSPIDGDGGPTTWQAVIDDGNESYREFLLEFADFQHAYSDEWHPVCPNDATGLANRQAAINPPGRNAHLPHFIYEKEFPCPISGAAPPCPEAISADNVGTSVVNYRNEPVAMRVRDPNSNTQAAHTPGLQQSGDLSFAYQTRTDRLDPNYNLLPGLPDLGPYPPLTRGLVRGDPYTPLMRAHEADLVKIKVLVGAHEEEHNFSMHGVKWLSEPANPNSGYRNSWPMGISEFTEMEIGHMPGFPQGRFLDFLYMPTSAAEWQWEGMWGLLRLYRGRDSVGGNSPLEPLPNNPDGRYGTGTDGSDADNGYRTADSTRTNPGFNDVLEPTEPGSELGKTQANAGSPVKVACPAGGAPDTFVQYDLTAVAAKEVLPNNTLTYNRRSTTVVHWNHPDEPQNASSHGPLHDPTAIIFVETSDLIYDPVTHRPTLAPDAPVEPIILRAKAGDCIEVVLRNDLPGTYGTTATDYTDIDGWSGMTPIVEFFNANDVDPSLEVGLHPQLVFFDVRQSDGANVGLNPVQYQRQTVAPGEKIAYYWYAGHIESTDTGIIATPVEFGAVGLASSDPIKHTQKGAVGALIIEPEDSRWDLADAHNYETETYDRRTRAEATVYKADGSFFREFVLVTQDDINLQYTGNDEDYSAAEAVMSMKVNEDAQETGQKAYNYRTDPVWFRRGYKPESDPTRTRQVTNFDQVFNNAFIGGLDPVTHVFNANAGTPTRFRVVHPGGHTQQHVPQISGHEFQKTPYTNASTVIGNNPNSPVVGARNGSGPTDHFDAVLTHGAGGPFRVTGDYHYGDYVPWYLVNGLWGIFRVE